MRTTGSLLTLLSLLLLAAPAARGAQDAAEAPQTFRSGIDLITVDVTILDRQGRPVEDLRAEDFRVRVDGRARRVVSAELVRFGSATDVAAASGLAPLVTSNVTAEPGRRIVLAFDQFQIRPGTIAPLLGAASRFVDGLAPADHVALVTIPEPGPRVDFTTDRDRVHEALRGFIGQPAKVTDRQFDMSLAEALALSLESVSYSADRPSGPALDVVLARGCGGTPFGELDAPQGEQCRRSILLESRSMVQEARDETTMSLRLLESVLRELIPLEGSKSLVLISGRLFNEHPLDLDEVIRLAAAARTSIDVIAVGQPDEAWSVRSIAGSRPPSTLLDRSLELEGLRAIASATGGSMARAVGGTGDGIFERIATALSASYVVAVEREPDDPDRQPIQVEVRRRGVTVRANRTFVATAAIDARRPMEDVLRDALASPFAITGLPLRISTFIRRDAASGARQLHVAAEIGPPGAPPGEFAIGYALMDDRDRPVTSAGIRRSLAPAGAGPEARVPYGTTITLEPGTYSLRLAAVDAEGRRGSVVHRVTIDASPGDTPATSDLIVGPPPAAGGSLAPGVEPRITDGQLAAYLELYPSEGDAAARQDVADDVTVRLEIAEGEAAPALVTRLLNLGGGPHPDWRVATGAIDTPLLPGRYVARATVRRGDAVRVLARPFVLVERPADAARTLAAPAGLPVPPEVRARTAAYAAGFVTGFANVVAEEAFALTGPTRRVTSDFLLVQYPGSARDLLTYRDVTHVDGTPRAGRQERLTALFLEPQTRLLRARARAISLDAEAHVPSMLNPLFVLAFLQADYQSRFEFTAHDAGPDWPAAVTAVTLVETARPTLLRAGPLADQDVPARGTAWIEEATGRILQTELQLGTGRSAPTVTTRFRLDERLQIMVPALMRTQNPAGVATYRNFRRFTVETGMDLDGGRGERDGLPAPPDGAGGPSAR